MPTYSWPIGEGPWTGSTPRYGHRSEPQTQLADSRRMASVGSMILGFSRSSTRTSPGAYRTAPRMIGSLVVTRAGGGPARGDAASLRQLLAWLVVVRSRSRDRWRAWVGVRNWTLGPTCTSSPIRMVATSSSTTPARWGSSARAAPAALSGLAGQLAPGPRVVAEQRVDEHVDAAAAVEKGSTRCSLELESTLLRDPPARGVLGHHHPRDAVDLLCPEQVVNQEAHRLGRVPLAGMLLVVQLVGELVRVPVVDRSEVLDVADHDVVPVPDEQGAPIPLPKSRLGVGPPENRLRLDAKGEELAAVGDLGVRVDECREIALTHRTQHDLVPVEHNWPLPTFPCHRPSIDMRAVAASAWRSHPRPVGGNR